MVISRNFACSIKPITYGAQKRAAVYAWQGKTIVLKKLQAKENRGCETSLESQSPREDTVGTERIGNRFHWQVQVQAEERQIASKVVPSAEYFQDIKSHKTVM